MNGSPFKLATLAKPDGNAFVAIVLGDDAIDLAAAQAAYRASSRKGDLSAADSMLGLLENWDANFAVLQEIVAFLEKEGCGRAPPSSRACMRCRRCAGPARCSMRRRTFRNMSTRCSAPA